MVTMMLFRCTRAEDVYISRTTQKSKNLDAERNTFIHAREQNDAVNFVSFTLQHHNRHEQGRRSRPCVRALTEVQFQTFEQGISSHSKTNDNNNKMIKLTVQGLVTRANTSKSCNRRTEWKERTNEERRNRISLGCGNCPVAHRQNGSESRTHVLCIQSCWGACRLDQVGAEGEEEEEEGGGGGKPARESRGREGSLQWPVVLCHTPCMPACLQTQANEQGVGETSAPAATLSPGEIRPCASPIASNRQASLSAL